MARHKGLVHGPDLSLPSAPWVDARSIGSMPYASIQEAQPAPPPPGAAGGEGGEQGSDAPPPTGDTCGGPSLDTLQPVDPGSTWAHQASGSPDRREGQRSEGATPACTSTACAAPPMHAPPPPASLPAEVSLAPSSIHAGRSSVGGSSCGSCASLSCESSGTGSQAPGQGSIESSEQPRPGVASYDAHAHMQPLAPSQIRTSPSGAMGATGASTSSCSPADSAMPPSPPPPSSVMPPVHETAAIAHGGLDAQGHQPCLMGTGPSTSAASGEGGEGEAPSPSAAAAASGGRGGAVRRAQIPVNRLRSVYDFVQTKGRRPTRNSQDSEEKKLGIWLHRFTSNGAREVDGGVGVEGHATSPRRLAPPPPHPTPPG